MTTLEKTGLQTLGFVAIVAASYALFRWLQI
jgi:hypothetical protein